MPAKPPTTQAQRRHDTDSCSAQAATTVSSSGVSITTAVNSPTCITARLRKASALEVMSSSERSSWIHGRPVRSSALRWRGHSTAPVTTVWIR